MKSVLGALIFILFCVVCMLLSAALVRSFKEKDYSSKQSKSLLLAILTLIISGKHLRDYVVYNGYVGTAPGVAMVVSLLMGVLLGFRARGRQFRIGFDKMLVIFGFTMMAGALFSAVRHKPEILHHGLAGITPTPDGLPDILKSALVFLIWYITSCVSVPFIVKAFFPATIKTHWLTFVYFALTYIFVFGLPIGLEWIWAPLGIMLCSGFAVFSICRLR